MSDQQELPGMLTQPLASLVDASVQIPVDYKWPETAGNLLAVIEAALKRKKVPDPLDAAKALVLVIAQYLGGRNLYLPTGESIQHWLRDAQLYREWQLSGQPDVIEHLANKYELTERRVYAIIAFQRALRRKQQGELFQ